MTGNIKLALAALFALGACSGLTPGEVEVMCDGGQTVRLQVVSPEIVRVTEVPKGKITDRESLVILPQEIKDVSYTTETSDSLFTLRTDALTVTVDRRTASLSFFKVDGTPLATDGAASFRPLEVEGKQAWSTSVSFFSPEDEDFYGLGQQQVGTINRKGLNEELYQYNTKISIPFVVSSKGYGMLFDAYSLSRWGNPEPPRPVGEVFTLHDKDGVEGALTGTYIAKDGTTLVRRETHLSFDNERAIRDLPDFPLNGATVIYEGTLTAPQDGDYFFSQYYAGFQSTVLSGEKILPRCWRPAWNPNTARYSMRLIGGEPVRIRIEWEPDGDVSYLGLSVAEPRSIEEQERLTFSSEFEPSLDFYFISGDSYDDIIRGYRRLTGRAQVMPRWALGFWQSRERYSTQEDLVTTLAEFRRRHIPLDNIVQDWQYWKDDQWGSHEFDPERYPDPEKMLDDVHSMHARFMISVWPKFYTNTAHYKELKDAGYMYLHPEDSSLVDWLGHRQSFYDAYAEGGRKMFWRQMDESLYTRYGRKIDAWWMDASEPNLRDCLPMDYFKWLLTPNALGSSTEYLNAYALVNAQAIYEGQRSVDPEKRVFLLTRNGFSGLQRYSTASWSGDIGTTWDDMRIQMSAGLGYCLSGIPFWGMDIGGFSVLGKFYGDEARDEWQELQTRWHQFGTFVPLFRTHGQWPRRELWNIADEGTPAYESILWYMRLRYRLMPYLYSLAGAVCLDDYTMMRALVMDFPDDGVCRNISDQWMLGPALMPCPVYEYKARSREVYFPEGCWYDFYTGEAICTEGGFREADAPYGRIPLYVRGGSIIPLGPEAEWTGPAEDILLVVYAGADADFALYEDDGETYAYENGEYSRIRIHWDDESRTLTLGPREGAYKGDARRLRAVVCDSGHPFAYDPSAPGIEISYDPERTNSIVL